MDARNNSWTKKKLRYSEETQWFPEYFIALIEIGNFDQETSRYYHFNLKYIQAERPNGTIKELKCICDKFPENGTVCPKKQKTTHTCNKCRNPVHKFPNCYHLADCILEQCSTSHSENKEKKTQWAQIFFELEFKILANKAASGGQFSDPLGMRGIWNDEFKFCLPMIHVSQRI